MTAFSAQSSVLVFGLALPAWSIFLLGIALAVGLANKRRPSIFVDLFIIVLVSVHVVQILIATYQPDHYLNFILRFGFIPMRYVAEYGQPWAPGGWPAYIWTPFTYAFLHGDGWHLFTNGLALFIFGRTVAWRFGGLGFLAIFAASSVAGAITYMIFNWGGTIPLIGASAGAFGVLGATFRFVPKSDDRLKALFWPDENLQRLPLAGFWEMVTERRSLVYILLCLIIYPLGLIALLAGTSGNISVMAHVGGFAFGLFGIGYFDRRGHVSHKLGNDVGVVSYSKAGTVGSQPTRPLETEQGTKTESPWMKLLRIIAFIMMIVGIILGIVGYYLQAFHP